MNAQVPSEEPADPKKYHYSGRMQKLSAGRAVFLGTEESGEMSGLFLRFVNEAQEVTMIRLSPEAMDAVVQLYALHLRDLTSQETQWALASEIKNGDLNDRA